MASQEFFSLTPSQLENGRLEVKLPESIRRFMALDRRGFYWNHPVFGGTEFTEITQGQFLLAELEDGSYWVALPLVDGPCRAYLVGDGRALFLDWNRDDLSAAQPATTLLCTGIGSDVFELLQSCMNEVQDRLKTFNLRETKARPEFINWLGWCTWDAFYGAVDEKGVLAGLESFRTKGTQLGWMILDDGWLDNSGDLLNDTRANPVKFPLGLQTLAFKAKTEFGLKLFGVWHAYEGYWGGVNPDGTLGEIFQMVRNQGNIRPWQNESQSLSLVHPDQIASFYRRFHSSLSSSGVDFIKVDGQSALEIFTEGVLPRVSSMRAYQDALQASAHHWFKDSLIHCMSNGSDVLYSMKSSLVFRNSDDYFPRKPESHGWHLAQNAMNSLWTSWIALPDWDMFWSGHETGDFHAAARSISGGPVYVSDEPGRQDPAILERVAFEDGRVPLCQRPALPAVDSIFEDPRTSSQSLKLTNLVVGGGVIGVFNCLTDGEVNSAFARLTDIHDFKPDSPCIGSLVYKDGVHLLGHTDQVGFELPGLEWGIVQFSQLADGWCAVIGEERLFVPGAAIDEIEIVKKGMVKIRVKGKGRYLIYTESPPTEIFINDESVSVEWANNLISLELSGADTLVISK